MKSRGSIVLIALCMVMIVLITACAAKDDLSSDESDVNKGAEEVNGEKYDYSPGEILDTSYQSEWLNICLDIPQDYEIDWEYMDASKKLADEKKADGNSYQITEVCLKDKYSGNRQFYIDVYFPKENKEHYEAVADIRKEINASIENEKNEYDDNVTFKSTWLDYEEVSIYGNLYTVGECITDKYIEIGQNQAYDSSRSSLFLCTVKDGYTVLLNFVGFSSWNQANDILLCIESFAGETNIYEDNEKELCSGKHNWEPIVESFYHEPIGHYVNDIVGYDSVDKYYCSYCEDEKGYSTFDDVVNHFRSVHSISDKDQIRQLCYTSSETVPVYGEKWNVDREGYYEDLLVGQRCLVCDAIESDKWYINPNLILL